VHRDTFTQLVIRHDWTRGAELGVGKGHLSTRLLMACPDLHLIGVDLGLNPERWERLMAISELHPRYRLLRMSTADAAALVPDGSLDFVFVDASHKYKQVRRDLELWEPKVRPGGWFGGHDFHEAHPGVIRAVTQRYGQVDVLPGWIWVRP
jgi:predicted O-methyltransferase YrrM